MQDKRIVLKLYILNIFSVTRSKRNTLNSFQYTRPIRVQIHRRAKLDELAISKKYGRKMRRFQSAPDLSTNQPTSAQTPAQVSAQTASPLIDMSKVRSILKQPLDKAKSIFIRRKSMPNLALPSASHASPSRQVSPSVHASPPQNVSPSVNASTPSQVSFPAGPSAVMFQSILINITFPNILQ